MSIMNGDIAVVSTQNGDSAKVNFEANTNPLYEFTRSENMSGESSDPLLDFGTEAPAPQKEVKQEPTNPLYDLMGSGDMGEQTNGPMDDLLVNGVSEPVQNGDHGDQVEQEVDLLGTGDSWTQGEQTGDLLGDMGPATSDDSGVTIDTPAVEEEQREETLPVTEEEPDMSQADTENREEDVATAPEVTEDNSLRVETDNKEEDGLDNNDKEGANDTDQGNVTEPEKTQDEQLNEQEGSTSQQVDDNTEVEQPIIEADTDPVEEDMQAKDTDVVETLPEAPIEETVETTPASCEDVMETTPDAPTEIVTETAPPAVVEEVVEEEQEEEEEKQEEPDVIKEVVPVEQQEEPEQPDLTDSKVSQMIEEPEPETVIAEEAPVEPEVEKVEEQEVPVQESTKIAAEMLQEEPETVREPDAIAEAPVEPEVEKVEEQEVPVQESTEIAAEMLQKEQAAEEKVVELLESEVDKPTDKPDTLDLGEPETRMSEVQAETQQETQSSQDEENAQKVNGTSNARENGLEEEEVERDPDIFRETRDKEEVHFTEMSNVRQKFESGGTRNDEPAPRAVSVRDEYDAGGEFENQPVINPDVVRESDRPSEELPEVGTARNLADRFKNISEEKSKPVASGKRVSPPRATEKVEYESQPTEHIEQYQGQSEAGEFESQPNVQSDVVRSGDKGEDYTPEKGSAKNIMNRFKEQQTESSQYKLHEKREMTPDRSGKVEFVSEPRGQSIQYTEAQSESGVYENVPKVEEDVVRSGDKAEEPLPEQGMAKNLLSKFKQLETEAGNKPPPSPQRAVSQERKGKVEARGYLERYEPTVESGEYENKPESRPDVIKSGEAPQEVLPEVGMAKKTLERFKEIQKQSTSPVSAKSKEFTPPRESSPGRTVAGVVENTPESHPDVVRSGDLVQDDLPEQGSAKNILNKFKEIQSSSSQSSSPGRKQKEFTPPPEAGVYENTPQKHLEIETRQSESGIIENTPAKSTADNARERECVTPESELPEQGMAKNLVSKWKQIETTSAKSTASASPRFKEFTPPRETRGPMSPKSPAGTVTNGVHPNELPGQYQPQTAPTTYENDPQRNADVYREVDTDWEAGMPAPNTTASMLSRFKEIQQKAAEDSQTPAPVTRKESSPPREDPEDKGMFRVVQTEKCSACEKTVYAMEKLELNGHVYHKNCFKCSHCSARLTPKTFSMNEGVIYCVNHFKQLFARKGNYDEGFGRQQYKKSWGEKKKEGATA
ncbi:titin-like isoform X8 [Mya arenaria]|uniref:titin-like isoform X8 n=1 Tax=Mya arenaria TaxID=6604 RepID=UPI0022E2BBBA|nr:titin-like isoform X8 [Mya arenaria]